MISQRHAISYCFTVCALTRSFIPYSMFLFRPALLLVPILAFACSSAFAQQEDSCAGGERSCILLKLENSITEIEESSWRDAAWREYAKTLAFDGRTDEAIKIVEKISSPDTKAMTIRGIGMAMSDNGSPPEIYRPVFERLKAEAGKIDHAPSHAIAFTYIAMAQAFAGDNAGAEATAMSMENPSLRNKALGESAEIQAQHGDLATAERSLSLIDDKVFFNKASDVVSQVFAKNGYFAHAFTVASKIENPTLRAGALQFALDSQKPRDVERKSGGREK